MPIELQNPIQRAPVTRAEITAFTVDLRDYTLSVRIAELTDSGEVVREFIPPPVHLLADGQQRFAEGEYASIKGAIYRLLLADGVVSGVVT